SPVMMGRRVAVIGGGNVATDDARTSRRLGAQEVDIVYRRSRGEMPARADELEGCAAEGVNFRFLAAPKRIELGQDARLKLTLARMELGEPDESGRRRPLEVPGSEFEEDCDVVIAAIGQEAETYPGFKVQTGKGGRVQVREDSLATSRPGVFAGGDCVLGPATLIEAVAQGRTAAAAMDKFLGGDGDIEEKLLPEDWDTDPFIGREEGFNRRARLRPIFIAKERRLGWDEVELGLDEASGRAEGLRCLKCNLAAGIQGAVLPPEAWLEFSAGVVAQASDQAGVFQLLDADKNVLMIKGVQNLRRGLSEQLGKNEAVKYFVCEEAPMYTQRESQFIQAYLQQYGKMPGGGASELDDLF
ncbi:MAG: FAD-dependent oxidoreductase, partial [Betaproteobacteria bacterium]|nr:FAD-dependent oxidoreductase [Betaproteobacteria bacterium]